MAAAGMAPGEGTDGSDDRSANERRLAALIEFGADVITLHREDGAVFYAAPSLSHILGYSVSDWLGRHLADLVHEEDRAAAAGQFTAMREAPGIPQMARFRLRHKGGAWRWMEATGTNLLGDPTVRGLVLNQHDVTERRAAEDALRGSEERFRALVENSDDSIQLATARGTLLYVSPSTEKLYGRPTDEIVGRSVFELHHGEERERLTEQWQRCLDHPRVPVRGEFRLPAAPDSGDRFVETVRVNHLQDPGLRAVVTLCREVTERRRLETRIQQTQRLEAIGRLAGGIAHDFNNILSAIHGFASIVEGELPERDPLRVDVREILRAVDRAANLTRQLLAFGRRQLLQPKVIEISGYVRDLERMLRRIVGEDVEILLRLDETGVTARADPGQLEQVLINLVINARDAMPTGGRLTIETANVMVHADDPRRAAAGVLRSGESLADLPAGPYAVVTVTDTGLGMSESVQEHIFEPFFSTKASGQGSGLGLSTVFGIVKQSGGHIHVDSETAQGSTFRIYFPASPESPPRPVAPATAPVATGGAETILLVEDEPAVRAFVARALRQQGYQVLDASNGGEAVLIAEQHPDHIHLLLTDVIMPRCSGKQLAERLLRTRTTLRVLFMSGYTEDIIAPHGLLADGTAFIEKPLTAESLGRKIREVLDRR
jgi:two-component system, cell cycle sensor histidine kinase and response regulator CckA